MEEFMNVVKQTYGEKVLIQFEDLANHNAFDLLAKYSKSHLVFNDDIQGTSVVLAGLLASLKVVGGTLAEHTYLFLGVGEKNERIIGLESNQRHEFTGRRGGCLWRRSKGISTYGEETSSGQEY